MVKKLNKLRGILKPASPDAERVKIIVSPVKALIKLFRTVLAVPQFLSGLIASLKITALFFWLARLRRELRHRYRDFATFVLFNLTRAGYKVEVRGLENFTYTPSTILACSHKRDADIGVIIPRLYRYRKPSHRKQMRLLYEATRDDFYERGFLVTYLPWLDWARPVLARLSVARLMHALQTAPVKLPDEQTVNQLLQETRRLDGNQLLTEAVTEEWRVKLMGQDADKPGLRLMDAILKAPFEVLAQYGTPRMFKEPLCSRIRERYHQNLKEQLHYLTRIIDKGGTLFVLPEGRLSPDGRFCKMRAALTRLVQNTRADVRLTPVNVTYDFMDTRHPRAIMIVGKEITGIKRYAKNELAEMVGRVIPGLAPVMMSGLASRYLIEKAEAGKMRVRYFQMRDDLWEEFLRLRGLELEVDHELESRQGFEERLERFIAYCKQKGGILLPGLDLSAESADSSVNQLHRGDEWLFLDVPSLLRQECQRPDDNPVRYCYNELVSMLEARGLVVGVPAEVDNVISFKAAARQHYTAG